MGNAVKTKNKSEPKKKKILLFEELRMEIKATSIVTQNSSDPLSKDRMFHFHGFNFS